MAYFEAKMHQIRFRLGLCLRPCSKTPAPLFRLRNDL